MANSYIPKWQNISVNFNDANSMMSAAIDGISKAGTVFDKLHNDIATEEQRAAEAAYKQQVFDENVRQFDLEQAWKRQNAEDERSFRLGLVEKEDELARKRLQLKHNLDSQVTNKNTSAYNALNTFFTDSYKKTGDLVKAAEATRAYANANYGNVLFDDNKIFGNLASAVAQGYSPENRFLRGWTTVREGAAAEANLPGINKTLNNSHNGYFTKDGMVMQVGADGNIHFVPDNPESKQFLDLHSDKARYTQMGQGARDFLKSVGFGPLEINRILSNTASKSVEDQEAAGLALASKLGVVHPDKIPVMNAVMKGAEASRTTREKAAEAEIERKKTFTPEAYNKAYMEVYDEAGKNEDTKDIFNVGKNPKLNASIELLSEAMRKQEASASEFKKILKQLTAQGSGWFSNDDITSKDLNNPILIKARDKFLPNLVKPTVEKPETPTPTAADNANNNSDILKTPSTEKLKDSDARLATTVIKTLKANRYALQQIVDERDEEDRKRINDQIAYLDAAIASLQNNDPITVSNSDAYAFLQNVLNRAKIFNTTANEQGDAVFTRDKDIAARYLRLMKPTQ